MTTPLPPRLRDVLGGVGARLGLEDARATGLLWARWAEIVGDAVATNAEPTSLRKGVLRIRTTTPAWAQELSYLTAEIRARANVIAGRDVVREIRVWTGPGEVTPTPAPAPGPDPDGDRDRAPGEVPADLPAAFERARGAWARRRSDDR